jgi:outer membrane protein
LIARADETSAPVAVPTLSLTQAIDVAVKESEQLKISGENRQQAEFRRKQALGAVLPDVHWVWGRLWQERGGANNSLNNAARTDSRFTATQPLFNGFKEFASMSAFKAQSRQADAQLRRDTVLLTLDVADAFYQVIQLETYSRDLDALIQLTDDRLKDLRDRVRLGRSRKGDVMTEESQASLLNATKESTAGSIVAARDALGFLLNRNVRATVIIDSVTLPSPLPDEAHYLALASKRSDIVALEESVMYYRYGIRVAQSGHYPFLDLVGNYYTQRTGLQSDIRWDVALDLDVPLYQGGAVSAQVNEARSLLRQAELQLHRQRRLANSEISQAYAMLISSLRQVDAYSDAAQKARLSYDAQSRDYHYGLIDNLQVLESMNSMQNAIVSYHTALVQAKLNYLKLQSVTEDLR